MFINTLSGMICINSDNSMFFKQNESVGFLLSGVGVKLLHQQ